MIKARLLLQTVEFYFGTEVKCYEIHYLSVSKTLGPASRELILFSKNLVYPYKSDPFPRPSESKA